MAGFPSRCVIDSNALHVLHTRQVLPALVAVPVAVFVPDILVAVLRRVHITELLAGGVQVSQLSGAQLESVTQLRARYPQTGAADLCALLLARREVAILLTSDSHLRAAAEQEGVATTEVDQLLTLMAQHTLMI